MDAAHTRSSGVEDPQSCGGQGVGNVPVRPAPLSAEGREAMLAQATGQAARPRTGIRGALRTVVVGLAVHAQNYIAFPQRGNLITLRITMRCDGSRR